MGIDLDYGRLEAWTSERGPRHTTANGRRGYSSTVLLPEGRWIPAMLEIPYRQHARVDRPQAVVSRRPHPRIDRIDRPVTRRQVPPLLVWVRVFVTLFRRIGQLLRSDRRNLAFLRLLCLCGFVLGSLAIVLLFSALLRFFVLRTFAIMLRQIRGTFPVVLFDITSVVRVRDQDAANADHGGPQRFTQQRGAKTAKDKVPTSTLLSL